MNIIDTYWEKRNLGVESAKIVIQIDDSEDTIESTLATLDKDYIEADIPTCYISGVRALEKNGFHFMEVIVDLGASVNEIILPKSIERAIKALSYVLASEIEIEITLDLIESGEMFITDKISLNPSFGAIKAGYRYKKWAEQLINDDMARCYVIKSEDKLLGFEIVKTRNDVVELCIGGSFPQAGAGCGVLVAGSSYQYWKVQGFNKIITSVSSNNLPILKIHELFGLKVQNMRYIMVKNK